jgi:hypothetical protein
MATKKGLCPDGQVPDGKGGCKTLLPVKPKVTTKVTETAEEKAAKAEAAKKAEEARIGNLSNREFRKESKNADRVVELANRKAGKETTSRGGKILKKIGAGVTSALAATLSGLEIAEKIKELKKEKKGGAINNKLKTIGNMKTTRTKMKMGGAKKYGEGGPTTKSNSKPTKSKSQPNTPPTGENELTRNPNLKNNNGPKKINTGGGIPITQKAADRKVAKGKGMMTYKYGNMDAPGTGNNKGTYVRFAKDQEPNPWGGKSLKSKGGRKVMKMGGATKKK